MISLFNYCVCIFRAESKPDEVSYMFGDRRQ